MPKYIRAFCERTAEGKDGEPIRFVASTEEIARDGFIIDANGWDLANYRANPVVLWVHDYKGDNLPVGRADAQIDGKQLIADVTFDQSDEFARQIESKYRRKFLNAVSVGWETKAMTPGNPPHITRAELLDISAVPVPGDPKALIERQLSGLRAMMNELEGATEMRPYPNEHACRLRDPGDFQTGTFKRTRREHEGKEYFVIMGKLKGEDTMTEQAYRYPKDTWSVSQARSHCESHDGKLFEPAANQSYSNASIWDGVASAMLALYRNFATIEDEDDHRAIYNKLEQIYRKLGKTPPEYRKPSDLVVLECSDIDALFLEGEARAGAVLNKRNSERLKQAQALIQEVLDTAEKEKQTESVDPALTRLHQVFQTTRSN